MSRVRSRRSPARLGIGWRTDIGGYVSDLAFSPDGKSVAAASVEGPVRILDVSGTVRHGLDGHSFGTTTLSWRPDSRSLASSGQDGKVRLWEAVRGEEKAALDGGSAWVEKVAFSPDGRFLVSTAGRGLRMWRPDGTLLWESLDHGSTVADVAWQPGSSKELVCAAYGGLTLYRPSNPEPTRRFRWQGSTLVIAWSPNGKHIATGDQDATVHFWTVGSGEDLQMWGYPTKVRELSWNSTSRYLATGGGPLVTVWDCSGKGPSGTKPISLEAHEGLVGALAFQRRGSLLASAGEDGLVALWKVGTEGSLAASENVGSPVSGISWSPDEQFLAAGCEDGTVAVLEAP